MTARPTPSWVPRSNNPQQHNKNLCINIKSGTHHRAALFSPLPSFCFAFASGLALVLVFLCPFPRMLFGYPCIVFIVIPSFPCCSVQFSGRPILLSAQCVVLGAIVVKSSCLCCWLKYISLTPSYCFWMCGNKIYLDFLSRLRARTIFSARRARRYEVLSSPHLLKIKRTSFARSETKERW